MEDQSLRSARKDAGFTQQQMADELGVSRATYIEIENDPTRATILQAKRICTILSRSYERIFFGRSDS